MASGPCATDGLQHRLDLVGVRGMARDPDLEARSRDRTPETRAEPPEEGLRLVLPGSCEEDQEGAEARQGEPLGSEAMDPDTAEAAARAEGTDEK